MAEKILEGYETVTESGGKKEGKSFDFLIIVCLMEGARLAIHFDR